MKIYLSQNVYSDEEEKPYFILKKKALKSRLQALFASLSPLLRTSSGQQLNDQQCTATWWQDEGVTLQRKENTSPSTLGGAPRSISEASRTFGGRERKEEGREEEQEK